MTITREEILHVADLARLEIDDAALSKLTEQIGQILEYMETLNQIDTTGIPGTSHAITLTNAFREDTVHAHLANEQALANAPEKEDGAFVVPKVVGR